MKELGEKGPEEVIKKESEPTGKKKSLTQVMGEIDGVEVDDDAKVEEHEIDLLSDEIENNPAFKGLTNAQKDAYRKNGLFDPDASLFDGAVDQTRQNMVDEINRHRASKNLEPITLEQFTSGNIPKGQHVDESDGDTEIEDSFKRQLALIAGEESDDADSNENDDTDRIKRLKEFERQLAAATLVEFDNPNARDSKSAALTVKIDHNTEYVENLKSVLDSNDIKFKTKKKGGFKKGLLRNFVQRNPHVTTPLVNSGIWVMLSGAAIPEIIQMNRQQAKKRSEAEMKKLGFIKKHLVETSIGQNLSLTQMAQLISYKDLQTLYFNLFIGSFPNINEFPVTCETPKCKHDLMLQIHSADLVLNADEFKESTSYILYQNTNVNDVLDQSTVSKEKQVRLGSKLMISFRNPTIWDVIFLSDRLEDLQARKDISGYSSIAGYLMYINYVALPDEDGDYVKFDDLEEMLELLNVLDEDSLDEIDGEVDEYLNKNVVKYGFKQYTCPKCKKVHKEKELDMSDFLFTLAQSKWAEKEIEKMNKKEALEVTTPMVLFQNGGK